MGNVKHELYSNKDREIFCPRCKKFLVKADRRDTTQNKIACKDCKILVWYVPKTCKRIVTEIPPRKTISGKIFY